jgi:hypothetical protein
MASRYKRRFQAAEIPSMSYVIVMAGRDKISNVIRNKLHADSLNDPVNKYREKWLSHAQRMNTDRIPRQNGGLSASGNEKKRWGEQT